MLPDSDEKVYTLPKFMSVHTLFYCCWKILSITKKLLTSPNLQVTVGNSYAGVCLSWDEFSDKWFVGLSPWEADSITEIAFPVTDSRQELYEKWRITQNFGHPILNMFGCKCILSKWILNLMVGLTFCIYSVFHTLLLKSVRTLILHIFSSRLYRVKVQMR